MKRNNALFRPLAAGSCLLFCLLTTTAGAEIRLPAIFGSHMVLQQNSVCRLWGWAAPEDDIIVLCSWLPGQEIRGRADRLTLRWSVELPIPAADLLPHQITIKGGWTDLVLDDLLLGEVWLCSGQSNMEWQAAWGNVEVTAAQYAAANDSLLRFFSVPRVSVPQPESDCRSEWKRSTRATMERFSAAAYFFGRELRDRLGVPVGLVNTSWGGTPIEAWMHEANFQGGELQRAINDQHPIWQYGRPGSLWNGMIAPLTSLKIKGFLWYQGETNTYNPGYYARLLEQLATDWRHDFGHDSLPFYYAQIAPWRYDTPREGAALRDEQRRALSRLRHAGMVVTSDIGDIDDIHPANKTDVGKRFAAWALARTYGLGELPASGPLYRTFAVEENRIRVFFDFVETGLIHRNGPPCCFEIAGEDRRFFPAQALVEESTVVVSAPEVARPVAVRFAFDNTAEPNLFNGGGLPASCFRTDDWPAVWPRPRFKVTRILDSGEALLEIISPNPDYRIRYTLDGSDPSDSLGSWSALGMPVQVPRGQTLKTRVYDAGGAPADRIDDFGLRAHLASGQAVRSETPAAAKYAGSAGAFTLTDGLRGRADVEDFAWLGYEGEDAVWTIDLGRVQRVQTVSAGFLVATADWVFPPEAVTIAVSRDGKVFTEVAYLAPPPTVRHLSYAVRQYSAALDEKTRYIRVSTKNVGLCPAWHQGKGKKAWMMVDEIVVD